MDKESVYSREQIEEICEEVERQWEYHLLSRGGVSANLLHGFERFNLQNIFTQGAGDG